MTKKLILILIIIVLGAGIAYFMITRMGEPGVSKGDQPVAPATKQDQNIITDKDINPDGYDDQSYY